MITVVEGVSAAGKTMWAARFAEQLVPEYSGPGPDAADPQDRAVFWAEVNARRWSAALEIERRLGDAWCDTDPCKLHYTWGMLTLGLCSQAEWDASYGAMRAAFEARRIGFVDRVVFLDVDEDEARERRESDPARSRRRFEMHVRLMPSLRRWYEAIDDLEPGRVAWVSGEQAPEFAIGPRADRCDPGLLDAVVEAVGARAV